MAGNMDGRRFERRPVQARVEIRMPSGVLLEGQSRDLSLRGLWFSTDRSLPIGNRTQVRLCLETGIGRITITSQGRVVRDDDGGVAIEFTDMGTECEDSLRRFVHEESVIAAGQR
jgi:hypothetical protein